MVKVRPAGIDMADPLYYTGSHGDGHDPRRRVPTGDVGGDRGPAAGRGHPFFERLNPDSGGGRLRCVRRDVVRAVLCHDGAAESGAGPLFPAAAPRVL